MTERDRLLAHHLERAGELIAAGDRQGAWAELTAFGALIDLDGIPEPFRPAVAAITAQCLGTALPAKVGS